MQFVSRNSIIIIIFLAFAVPLYKSLTYDEGNIKVYKVNKQLPDIRLQNLSGETIHLKEIEGKFVIQLFASWCNYCHNVHTKLVTLSQKHHGINIIGIAIKDNSINLEKFLTTYSNPYTNVLIDNYNTATIELGSKGIPETFLIENGYVKEKFIGDINLRFIAEFLNE
jgi:DsbE subfamily thiol:disulfide oxidoreductase